MDHAAQPIITLYELSHHILTLAAGDLSDQDARTRSRGGAGPSIAWTIGHLCHHKVQVLQLLGQPRDNPFAAMFEGAATDGRGYPPLADLVSSFSALNRDVCTALAAASDRLNAPAPDAGPHGEKRLAETIVFLAWHEAYHLGGIGVIRREQGRTAITDLARAAQAA